MKKKKGFIFIETMVVVAILTFSLLLTYQAYNGAVNKENIRLRYNDSAYMYRTYYFLQFFRNFRLDLVASNLNDNNIFSEFNCQNTGIFVNSENNKNLCENLFTKLNINRIYLTYADLGILQDCSDFKGKCEELRQFREEGVNYIRTIGGNGKSGYRILIEFEECKDGSRTSCDNNYQYYYTTLRLGEL